MSTPNQNKKVIIAVAVVAVVAAIAVAMTAKPPADTAAVNEEVAAEGVTGTPGAEGEATVTVTVPDVSTEVEGDTATFTTETSGEPSVPGENAPAAATDPTAAPGTYPAGSPDTSAVDVESDNAE